jgi:hypothetical protein
MVPSDSLNELFLIEKVAVRQVFVVPGDRKHLKESVTEHGCAMRKAKLLRKSAHKAERDDLMPKIHAYCEPQLFIVFSSHHALEIPT